jgi:hypothetical protein
VVLVDELSPPVEELDEELLDEDEGRLSFL